jgi:hypothetical protein
MDFFKFPRTPHLFVIPGALFREDKVMDEKEQEIVFSGSVILEEKVDGANVGISFNSLGELIFQNRGNYITPESHPQFNSLNEWAYIRYEQLRNELSDQFILFGEWCYLKHSIYYTKLPDWMLGFDIYERNTGKFLSVQRRNEIFHACKITPVPFVFKGKLTKADIVKWLSTPSQLYDGPIEGLYIRTETFDYLDIRAKLVQSDFIQTIDEHWTKKKYVKNHILSEYGNF